MREIAHDQLFDLVVFQRFLEEVLHVEHIIGDEAEELLKPSMFLARDLPVQDVVEEELRHHGRHHHVDLAPRQMDQHALEPADLTRDVESHAGGILSEAGKRSGDGHRSKIRELPMIRRSAALLAALLPLIATAAPHLNFVRKVPALHELGGERVTILYAIGDSNKVDTFIDVFTDHANRAEMLKVENGVEHRQHVFGAATDDFPLRPTRREHPADVYLGI